MLQSTATTKLSGGYAGDDRKQREEDIDSSIFANSNYYLKKKRKYPFYQHIDKAVDPQLKAIFAETYDYISQFVAKNNNVNNVINTLEDNHRDIHEEEDQSQVQLVHAHAGIDLIDDDEEKDIILSYKQSTKQQLVLTDEEKDDNKYENENENEDEANGDDIFQSILMPLTEAEIRKELNFSSNVAKVSKNTLNAYQEKLIETITKEFEKINFRSPSQEEISIILTKSLQKLPRSTRLTKNQKLLALNASKGCPTDVLFNSRKVVLDYLVQNLRNKGNRKSNEGSQDFLHNVLMFKIRQNSDL